MNAKKTLRDEFLHRVKQVPPGGKTVGESPLSDREIELLTSMANRSKQLNQELSGDTDGSYERCLLEMVVETGLDIATLDAMDAGEFQSFQLAAIRKRNTKQRSAPESEIETIARQLTGRGPAIFRYLNSKPNGVTFNQFMDYREPGTQKPLVDSDNSESVEKALRRLANKILIHEYEICVGESSNLIKMQKLNKT